MSVLFGEPTYGWRADLNAEALSCLMERNDAKTTDLAPQLTELQGQLGALRPLTSAQLAQAWPMVENESVYYTYATNAIEGSTLTRGETVNLLEYGVTVGGKPMRDHLDAVNGQAAFLKMLEMVRTKAPITESIVKDFHQIVAGADTPSAGLYRVDQRFITGSLHVPPAAHKVRDRMAELMWTYNHDIELGEHPVAVAARLHYGIGNIHPFTDYNGRTSRLVMNMHLLEYGYMPITIDLAERPKYLEALEVASRSGNALDGDPARGNASLFVLYIATMERQSLERYMAVINQCD